MSESPGFVAIGKILKPRGVQGEAFLQSLTDFPERFETLTSVRVELPDRSHVFLDVAHIRFYGTRLAIKFKGLDTPEAASRYRGAYIQVPQSDVHPLPEDTFYVFELVGLPVETASGKPVGRIVDVLAHPANDVYVINRNGEEVLIPAVREFVTIDRAAGKMVVREIDGLL